MGIEKTLDETQSSEVTSSLPESTIKKLNEFNPIDGLVEVNNEIETTATVVDLHTPTIDEIFNAAVPRIEIELQHTDIDEYISMDIVLDSFIMNSNQIESDEITLTSLLSAVGAHRQNIEELINQELPVFIERDGSGNYTAIPAIESRKSVSEIPSDPIEETPTELHKLWRAQQYGKARITRLNHGTNRSISVGFELPWCDRVEYVDFSKRLNNESELPPFSKFVEYVLGRPPITNSEYEAILGEEIPVDYREQFDIGHEVQNWLSNNGYGFKEYIKHNESDLVSTCVTNMAFVGLLMFFPPMIILPITILSIFVSISGFVAVLALILFWIVFAFAVTLQDAYSSYNNGTTIEFGGG